VVFGRNRRKAIGLIAVFLEIAVTDLSEDTGKTAFDTGLFLQIGRLQQDAADFRTGRVGHFLDAHDQDDPPLLRL